MVLLASQESVPPPPRAMWVGTLPVQGSLADAHRAGFNRCVDASRSKLRCRREGVMVAGQGPYSAAVDLRGTGGRGGFYLLTLWDNSDQDAVSAVGKALKREGWSLCRTGPNENRGDQEIYTKAGERVRFSIDISYWGKRRLRILPELHQSTGYCWST